MPISDSFSSDIDQKIAEELGKVIGLTLTKNERLINELNEMKTVAGWYGDAKKDPDKIPTIIVNETIERLLEYALPYSSKFLINSMKIEIQIHPESIKIDQVKIDFTIKPYVEYIKKADEIEMAKVKVTFSITITGKLENIKIESDLEGRQIKIGRFVAYLTISIIKAEGSISYLPSIRLSKPVILGQHQYFNIKSISFHLPKG